jgi:hypothetical protein
VRTRASIRSVAPPTGGCTWLPEEPIGVRLLDLVGNRN